MKKKAKMGRPPGPPKIQLGPKVTFQTDSMLKALMKATGKNLGEVVDMLAAFSKYDTFLTKGFAKVYDEIGDMAYVSVDGRVKVRKEANNLNKD
tara:strand:+ start:228 stop:509 length:282 start_codon:yes stop_codon:yes gene_type:complete